MRANPVQLPSVPVCPDSSSKSLSLTCWGVGRVADTRPEEEAHPGGWAGGQCRPEKKRTGLDKAGKWQGPSRDSI